VAGPYDVALGAEAAEFGAVDVLGDVRRGVGGADDDRAVVLGDGVARDCAAGDGREALQEFGCGRVDDVGVRRDQVGDGAAVFLQVGPALR